jgi:hypothetical protein
MRSRAVYREGNTMSRAKKRGGEVPAPDEGAGRPKAPRRKRLPSEDSVISEQTFTSPKGRVYRIIRTNQTDAYDNPASESGDEAGDRTEGKPARRKGKQPRKPRTG